MRPKTLGAKIKYHYQPALGVKTDFQRLLQNFSSAGTVRYEKFAECWREFNMSCYCAGRQNDREAREVRYILTISFCKIYVCILIFSNLLIREIM